MFFILPSELFPVTTLVVSVRVRISSLPHRQRGNVNDRCVLLELRGKLVCRARIVESNDVLDRQRLERNASSRTGSNHVQQGVFRSDPVSQDCEVCACEVWPSLG